MSGTGNTTVPASTDEPSPAASAIGFVPALVLVWSKEQPSRIGEVALFCDGAHSAWVLGRDGATADDPAPRAALVRQRPGANLDGGPLVGIHLSRRQLLIRRVLGGLEITNLTDNKVLVDGRPLEKGASRRIRPGAIVQIIKSSIFLLVERPPILPAPIYDLGPLHAFGEADVHGIVGESPAAWAFRAALAAAANTRRHVLIHGLTGTGKELAARAIHRLSGRSGRFVPYNAATLPPGLADSILFGNRAGYPNPGMPERPGLVGEARCGTLFLDEIGELSIEVQARLLRTLEGAYTRQGEAKPQPTDVLVVAATNRDLSVIKHDLLRRFAYVVETPSLAVRMEDVPLLLRAFILEEAKKNPRLAARFVRDDVGGRPEVDVSAAFILSLLRSTHDGNLRDLWNLMILAMTESATPPLMPPAERHPSLPAPAASDDAEEDDAEEVADLLGAIRGRTEPPSKQEVVAALVRHGWQIERTAKSLGMTRFALRRLMDKYEVKRPDGER